MKRTLSIPTQANGRVCYGTFTTTINGKRTFTQAGIYYLVEAFLIESNLDSPKRMHKYMDFSDETKLELSKRYGVGLHPMITGDVNLSNRINDENDNMSQEMRDNAFPIYKMFKRYGH